MRRHLLPGRSSARRLQDLLTEFCAGLDEVRGEHLHEWKQLDDGRFWLALYGNPLVIGRNRTEKLCHYWVSAIEALLRWSGLANDWVVEEIECGATDGSGDCVFSLRSILDL